jgi:hypothetical protein
MDVTELEQITADCKTGTAPNSTFHKILRGNKGNYGVQLVIDVTALNAAIAAGAKTFVSKGEKTAGHTMLALTPKVWPKKDTETAPNAHKKAKQDGFAPSQDFGDEIPF